jgi:hypothetical protein
MSIYEALIYVEPHQIESFRDAIFQFVTRSLAKRVVNLDNTIVLLGNLARFGDRQALSILHTLAHDDEPSIRENALLVLRGL